MIVIFCVALAVLGLLAGSSAVKFGSSSNKLLNSYPMIMAHDAASGEIIPERDHVLIDWTRTQSTGLVGQLDCGARSFDYRPYLLEDTLFAHHGTVVVHKTMSSSIDDIMGWCNTNPEELVVMYVTSCDGGDSCMEKSIELLGSKNVYTVTDCDALSTLTYNDAKKFGQVNGGGSMIAVVECTTENYDPTINCYGKDYACYDTWPDGTSDLPMNQIKTYITSTAAADPTLSSPNLWMNQAHWQSDAASVVLGTLHNSSLLEDESRSGLNVWVEQAIRGGQLKFVNIVELDNVCDNGANILSALETLL
jgi:hypothetical protein